MKPASNFQIRNLILVSVIDQSMSLQADFYRDQWLNPIEKSVTGPEELSKKLYQFIEQQTPKVNNHILFDRTKLVFDYTARFTAQLHYTNNFDYVGL
jgi:hypothetical protein